MAQAQDEVPHRSPERRHDVQEEHPAILLALQERAHLTSLPAPKILGIPTSDLVGDCYAHFEKTLEQKLKDDLMPEVHTACLAAACGPFGVHPSNNTQKILEIVYQTLLRAKEQGRESDILKDLVHAMWRFFRDEEISDPP